MRKNLGPGEVSQEDLESIVGSVDVGRCTQYLNAPKWDEDFKRWTCLANVAGSLCIVEVSIYARGEIN